MDARLEPLGEDYYEFGGPQTRDFQQKRRYRNRAFRACVTRTRRLALAFYLHEEGLIWLVTTDPRARTRRGVGIGDSAERVAERYPGARCHEAEVGDGDSAPGACAIPMTKDEDGVPRPHLVFGLDPDGREVRSVSLGAPSWRTVARLRRGYAARRSGARAKRRSSR